MAQPNATITIHIPRRLLDEAAGAGVHVSNALFVALLRQRLQGDTVPSGPAEEWAPGESPPLQMAFSLPAHV